MFLMSPNICSVSINLLMIIVSFFNFILTTVKSLAFNEFLLKGTFGDDGLYFPPLQLQGASSAVPVLANNTIVDSVNSASSSIN
jgi:hypothetical protein